MKAEMHMDTKYASMLLDPLVIPACLHVGRTVFSQIEVTGQARRKLVPCPLPKHWDFAKLVKAKHSQAYEIAS